MLNVFKNKQSRWVYPAINNYTVDCYIDYLSGLYARTLTLHDQVVRGVVT